MAVADYFQRNAVAAAHVIAGFDADAFRKRLDETSVGIALGAGIGDSKEARATLDLTTRLLARLYPRIHIIAEPGAEELAEQVRCLATLINPNIEFLNGTTPEAVIAIGRAEPQAKTTIFVGSDRWDASLSSDSPRPSGNSDNPFGAGAAACFAVSRLFRRCFLPQGDEDAELTFSTLDLAPGSTSDPHPAEAADLPAGAVLVGAGAIGNAVAWGVARSPLRGELEIVDPEPLDLGNLQRYVLTDRADEGDAKATLVAARLAEPLKARSRQARWDQFLAEHGYHWGYVIAAVDSAAARQAIQAALPRAVVNAWTQPGDLGVSIHPKFGMDGACLSCLYRAVGPTPNEDEVIAAALGIPDRFQEVRTLLARAQALTSDLALAVAAGLGQPPERVIPFVGRPLRDLYVEGVCGGAVLPLGHADGTPAELHVPLAHQSALAGVLAAACVYRDALGAGPVEATATRLDVLAPVPPVPTQPIQADSGCICRDDDYRQAYRRKWED